MYFSGFFYASYQISHNLLPSTNFIWVNDKLDFKIYFFKKNIVLFPMLPSCHVILPHPSLNIVMRAILLEFVLCINNLFKIKIIIY
jgi:hypothetical protein